MSTDSGSETGRNEEKIDDPPKPTTTTEINEGNAETKKSIFNFLEIDQYIEENSLEMSENTPMYLYYRKKGIF